MRVLLQRGGCPSGGWEAGKRVNLDENEVHHVRVRRAKDGESVEILDGAGLTGTGRLIQTGRQWLVEIQSAERQERPEETTLAVAAGSRDRFSWLVEKSVELGVTRIIPLDTARTSGVATRLKAVHLERLRRSALESIKQCGVAWAMSVEEPVALSEFLHQPLSGTGWVADREGVAPPAHLAGSAVTVVIGPEGGLTSEELTTLKALGYQPISLGAHTLRFETAALAAAAAVAQARLRGKHG